MAIAIMAALGAAALAIRLWSAWHARLSPEEASFWSTSVGIARAQEFPALGLAVSGSRAMLPGPLFFWIIAVSQIFVTAVPMTVGLMTWSFWYGVRRIRASITESYI